MIKQAAINIFNKLKMFSKPIPPVPEQVWQNPTYFVAFGFGSGAVPIAPGTFGTLMAIPFYLVLQQLLSPVFYIIFTVLFIIAISWLCERISQETHTHDHPGMCIDEFAGFFVTMIYAPPGWSWILLGFLLFRLFDVWKPWPIRLLDEKVHGGFGMVIDDVTAGVYACISMQLIQTILKLI